MPPRNGRREQLALLGLFCLAILAIIAFARLQAAVAGSDPTGNRVEVYHCNHAWYQRYEDGSGILFCNEDPMVRVHVSR